MILKRLLRIFDIKLYYNSEGLDFDEAIAIVSEFSEKHYYESHFMTDIYEKARNYY